MVIQWVLSNRPQLKARILVTTRASLTAGLESPFLAGFLPNVPSILHRWDVQF